MLLKGARNGIVYGTKIRFPHSLVNAVLFRHGTVRQKAHSVYVATKAHATTLAKFVVCYKAAMVVMRHLHSGKEEPHDAFVAGLVGGWLVFGRGKQSSVNQQIVMYVFARVAIGLAKLSVQRGVVPDQDGTIRKNAWPVFASLTWACVMWMFRWHPDTVQSSLRHSMVYLYQNADHWDGWKNYLWHNT